MKGNQNVIGNFVKHQVQPTIILDNMMHRIINLSLLIISNANSIAMIEQHNKILIELIMIGEKWKNVVLFILEYLHLT